VEASAMTARGRHRLHEPDQAREPGEEWRIPRRRGHNPIYELFVLGELMVQPMYGYWLHEVVNHVLGPFHQLSWGTLYPLIRRLEQEGLATSETEQKHGLFHHGTHTQAQARRVYRITEAGRERFFDLMLAPGEYCRAYPDLFTIKLTRFGFLTPEQRLRVLRDYRGYLSHLRGYWQGGQREFSDASLEEKAISESERPFILHLFDYHLHTLDAEISWIDAQIARLTEEARP
jgi:DNA-binding PadR family transcriptional regulator